MSDDEAGVVEEEAVEESQEGEDIEDIEEEPMELVSEILPVETAKTPGERKVKTTSRFLTKFERARLLGTRSLQISMNAPVMVDLEGLTDPLQIAIKELNERKIPLIIRRFFPDGSYEDWTVDELEVPQY